jgi:hypothetical protein
VADHVRPILDAGIDRHLIARRQVADDVGDERRIVSGVMPLATLNACCFSRRRDVSSIARSIDPVMRSA